MKLRNKKTGEIKDVESLGHEKSLRDKYGPQITLSWNTEYENLGECRTYNSLAELNEEWEDYEEPKEYWYVSCDGRTLKATTDEDDYNEKHISGHKEIGNYFETKEEAEKAVEKLKAWKRLKGGGFEFMSRSYGHDKTTDDTGGWIRFRVNHLYDERYGCEVEKDLDLLFGGEE